MARLLEFAMSPAAIARAETTDIAAAERLQLHPFAYHLGDFPRTLATPEPIEDWSLTALEERLIRIGAKAVSHGR